MQRDNVSLQNVVGYETKINYLILSRPDFTHLNRLKQELNCSSASRNLAYQLKYIIPASNFRSR